MNRKGGTLYSQDVPLSQAFEIGSGEKKEFPFEVMVPRFTPAHFAGSVAYFLKAVANVKGRPDVTETSNPMVRPAASASPTLVTQDIQKEVVKVPCKYCGTLMELTAGISKCPSCGAPIKL